MEYKDYYKTLGVARDASTEDIKRAYRKLARKYHPDVSKEANAENRFKDVAEAYEVLKDANKRAAYDQLGSNWQAGQGFSPPPGWRGGEGFEFRSSGGGAGFSDFFDSLFGRGFAGGHGPQHRPARGEDQQARVQITLEDAFHGSSRAVNLSQPGGRSRALEVRIPKGVRAGQRIRLAGQGSNGGDLYLEIEFAPHRLYRLEGADLYLDLPITPWEAALGATVKVPTLGGTVELNIPAGSQSGDKLRLRGRGLPTTPTPGDQYVVLKMVTPPALTDAARELYQRLASELPLDPRRALFP
ncbi:DnaJ C-terminal domain-containing protein [Immundisolibacter cernigliae]|uniref:Cytochrome C biogenesis protein n=1 Tax=Immundisolibacter cernigliae TaxID=1810504 RepID=A0A1B1YV65_9GAMM|nr:DnaJ C-terminal domain-containing protein [Immundisolibacter cernigliae]ANX04790.1 cytochrome C biogenesis protein [Immundisolibacter cernigliae]